MSIIISSTNTRHRTTVSNTSASTVSVGNGCTRRVVAPASTIAAVIASARAGDVIGISGVFTERVIVNKAVHLTSVLSDGVIDGENVFVANGNALVTLNAVSASISNIEVRNSVSLGGSQGLRLNAEATTANNMTVHDCQSKGIWASAPNTTVSNCTVYRVALGRTSGSNPSSGVVGWFWSQGINASRFDGSGVVNFINNRVYGSGGEGMACGELPSASCNFINNRISGSYSMDLHIQNMPQGALMEGNIIGPSLIPPTVINPPDGSLPTEVGINSGIYIANESNVTNPTQNVTVRNNFVSGTRMNLFVGTGPALYKTQSNMVYEGNTFVESIASASVRFLGNVAMISSSFTNNTIIQTNGLPAIQNFATGLTISGSGNIVNGVLL